MDDFDRHEATARARLERAVDRAEESVERLEDPPGDTEVEAYGVSEQELSDGMQIRAVDAELPADVDDWAPVRDDDLLDALAEAFNARDLDGIRELTVADCEVVGLASGLQALDPAIGDLWERRPSIILTRAVDDGHALGVLWERAGTRTWAPVGTAHVDADDEVVRVLEFSDDLGLIEQLDAAAPDADDGLWPDPDGLDDQPS